MAKSKSFFGLRTGSTKTLTFQVLNGKQITKDRVEIVKNPRTQSQMAQRCLMATASAAYTAMRKIVNHSFQGYSYGQQNMSKFISENVFLLRNAVEIGATDYGYNSFRDRSFKPGAYMISKGTLTPTIYTIDAVCETPRIQLTLMDGLLPSDYTANNVAAMMGLSLGEMSTICMIFGSDEAGWNFGFVRVRFIKAGDEPLNDERVFTQHFELESNISTPTITLGADYLMFNIYEVNIRQNWNVYFGAIYSRKSANGWLRSTSYITVPDGTELQPDYETALATYPQGTGYILNGAIIPNGGRVTPEPVLVPRQAFIRTIDSYVAVVNEAGQLIATNDGSPEYIVYVNGGFHIRDWGSATPNVVSRFGGSEVVENDLYETYGEVTGSFILPATTGTTERTYTIVDGNTWNPVIENFE